MKKIHVIPTLIFFAVCTLFLNSGYAQAAVSKPLALSPESAAAALKIYDSPGNEPRKASYANDINVKAMRYFRSTFKNVSNENWYIISDGYLAEFTAQDVRNRVVYDRQGSLCYYIQYYNAKNFPDKLSKIVRPTYYDYAIVSAEEVQAADQTYYIVHIQNDTRLKTIRVNEDEQMELIGDFTRY